MSLAHSGKSRKPVWLKQRGRGLAGPVEETALYSKGNGKALELRAGEPHNQFMFLKAHSGCPVESRLERAQEESRSLLRRPFCDPRYKTLKAWIRVKTTQV